MAVTMLIFAVQDGISQYLAREYYVFFIVMVRYWFFALFVFILCSKQPGGLRKAISTKQPFLQVFRGALLALEVIVMITSFTLLGLIESHAIFSIYPLLVAALSGPVLKEFVGWKRWSAIFIGLFQILSLVPGVSRSGISITAARFLNFNRLDAAKISFLLSIPTLGAVSIFGLKNLITFEDFSLSALNLVSIFLSFIFSLITINYFLKYIKKFSLSIFVLYRVILGLALLGYAYL